MFPGKWFGVLEEKEHVMVPEAENLNELEYTLFTEKINVLRKGCFLENSLVFWKRRNICDVVPEAEKFE